MQVDPIGAEGLAATADKLGTHEAVELSLVARKHKDSRW